jgi:DNA-binding beta-propeller fold protein YncE
LSTIGSHGDAYGQFARPKGIAVDPDGKIYVVDAAFENVQIFDGNGNLLLFFPEGGAKSAVSLVLPAGIAIDSTLTEYFTPLVSPDFQVEYLVLVASQYGDKKLSVFGFGQKR